MKIRSWFDKDDNDNGIFIIVQMFVPARLLETNGFSPAYFPPLYKGSRAQHGCPYIEGGIFFHKSLRLKIENRIFLAVPEDPDAVVPFFRISATKSRPISHLH